MLMQPQYWLMYPGLVSSFSSVRTERLHCVSTLSSSLYSISKKKTPQPRTLYSASSISSLESRMSGIANIRPRGGHFGLILPVVSASTTLGFAIFEYPMILAFLQARPSVTGTPFSRWWQAFFKPAVGVILGACLTSAISGLVCARWLRTHVTLETTSVSNWYLYGSVFALGHLAFVPFIARPIERVVNRGTDLVVEDNESLQAANTKDMEEWLTVHTVRAITMDLPALICFAEGVAQSFWII